jgi:hypothetical protein
MKSFNTSKSHKPPNKLKGEWIGIEIECFMPFTALKLKKPKEKRDLYGNVAKCRYSGKDAVIALTRLLKLNNIPNATIKEDGSIDSYDPAIFYEVEINLLINRNDYGPLERLCKLLKKLQTEVNDTCGLHVHLDCRDIGNKLPRNEHGSYDGKSIIYKSLVTRGTRLEKMLPLMMYMVDDSRLDNRFCSLDMSNVDSGRHCAINISAFREMGTIEVRLHESTINFKKIHDWIEFLFLVSRSKVESEEVRNFRDFKFEIPDAPKQVMNYVKRHAA